MSSHLHLRLVTLTPRSSAGDSSRPTSFENQRKWSHTGGTLSYGETLETKGFARSEQLRDQQATFVQEGGFRNAFFY